MKPLILAAALCLSASMAQAESFKLYSQGHWDVYYTTNDHGPSCVASVIGDGIYFSIDASPYDLRAWFISEGNDFGGTYLDGEVSVWIDGHVKWDTPAGALNDSIQMFGLTRQFLTQVMHGRRLYIDQDFDGQWDVWFSLAGSNAAMNALADCSNKL